MTLEFLKSPITQLIFIPIFTGAVGALVASLIYRRLLHHDKRVWLKNQIDRVLKTLHVINGGYAYDELLYRMLQNSSLEEFEKLNKHRCYRTLLPVLINLMKINTSECSEKTQKKFEHFISMMSIFVEDDTNTTINQSDEKFYECYKEYKKQEFTSVIFAYHKI